MNEGGNRLGGHRHEARMETQRLARLEIHARFVADILPIAETITALAHDGQAEFHPHRFAGQRDEIHAAHTPVSVDVEADQTSHPLLRIKHAGGRNGEGIGSQLGAVAGIGGQARDVGHHDRAVGRHAFGQQIRRVWLWRNHKAVAIVDRTWRDDIALPPQTKLKRQHQLHAAQGHGRFDADFQCHAVGGFAWRKRNTQSRRRRA